MTVRILSIDDDPLCLALREAVLREEGFDVISAEEGALGVLLAACYKVDAVVLDYLMPVIHGEQVARILRQEFPALPIVLCSGWGDPPEDIFKLVDGYVSKGDGPDLLMATLRFVLDRPNYRKSAHRAAQLERTA